MSSIQKSFHNPITKRVGSCSGYTSNAARHTINRNKLKKAVLNINPKIIHLVTGKLQSIRITNISHTITVSNIRAKFENTPLNGLVEIIAGCTGDLPPRTVCVLSIISYSQLPYTKQTPFTITGVNAIDTNMVLSISYAPPNIIYQTLLSSPLINADVWDDQPKLMSANYGFEGIQALSLTDANNIKRNGGIWNTIFTENAPDLAYTSAGDITCIAESFGYTTYNCDAMPICFSQPILSSTINPTTVRILLNTGKIVTPYVASLTPNFVYNGSSCIVVFGNFGNRLEPGIKGAIYPTTVSIVEGNSNGNIINLTLVGPNNVLTVATGMSIASKNPYQIGNGPTLLAAKISIMNSDGQDALEFFNSDIPNDGIAMYGAENAQYRLRMYSSAGFALGNYTPSVDRPMTLLPSDYNNIFQIEATDISDNTVYIYESDVSYNINGYGTIYVVGLAALGKAGTSENDAYISDNDNYFDIILKGDDAAMRKISYVNIPSSGTNVATDTPYLPLYNPGGPGNNPTPGVIFTQPSSNVHTQVINAIDNPNTVTYPPIN